MSTFCNRCGAPIADGVRFCNSCGAQQNLTSSPVTKFCVSCGRTLPPGASFCNNCGARVIVSGSQSHAPAPPASDSPVIAPIFAAPEAASATESNPPQPPEPPAIPAPQTEVPATPVSFTPVAFTPVQAPVPAASVPPVTPTKSNQGKGCITALIVTLIVFVLIVVAVIGGMIYVAHKVKNKVQEFATKEIQHAHDALASPDNTNNGVDLSDVPGSMTIAEAARNTCPEASPQPDNSETGRIPVRPGLTWVNAWRRFNGDVEVINKVLAVKPDGLETSEAGLGFNSDTAVKGNELDTTREVCHADLQNATSYYTHSNASLPHVIPGTTTFSMSRASFQTLKTTGKLTLTYQQYWVDGNRLVPLPRTADLTRVEPDDVNYPVILNGQPVSLPVIHAHGSFPFSGSEKVKKLYKDPSVLYGEGDLFVLDDPVNPMMLQFGFGPVFQIRVTSITFPEDKPKPQIEQQLEKEKKAVIYGIYFDFNEDTIKKESQPVLKEIADAMKNNPDWILTVNGYTDNIGGDAYNLDLSKRRAAAVKKALVDQFGIEPGRLSTGGFGASGFVDTNETLEGRARNRRVELIRQ